MMHKKLLNSISLKLEELEEENDNLSKSLEQQQDLIINFFCNCKHILKDSNLMERIQYINIEKDFNSDTIVKEFNKIVKYYHKGMLKLL